MLRLAWSVYSSKDFAETETVTGNLSHPSLQYRQQDPELGRCPELARPGKDTGDYSSELEPEPPSENRSTDFHRRADRRLSRSQQPALVDSN